MLAEEMKLFQRGGKIKLMLLIFFHACDVDYLTGHADTYKITSFFVGYHNRFIIDQFNPEIRKIGGFEMAPVI